jgi:hypothetical protein
VRCYYFSKLGDVMAKKFPDIEHSRIDALVDGIYAIALTL